jgi:hypothetical protein
MKPKSKQVLPHLKVWLLQGKTITQNQALKLWRTSRLSVFIHRLRKDHGMKIRTELKYSADDSFAEYSLIITKKKKLNFLKP